MHKRDIALIEALFAVLQDPSDESWCIVHHTGMLVGEGYPTAEAAHVDQLRIGRAALDRLRGMTADEYKALAHEITDEETKDILDYLNEFGEEAT